MNRNIFMIFSIALCLGFLVLMLPLLGVFNRSYQQKALDLYTISMHRQSQLIAKSIGTYALVGDYVNARMQLERFKINGLIDDYRLLSLDAGEVVAPHASSHEAVLNDKVDIVFKEGGAKWGELEIWFPSEEFDQIVELNRSIAQKILLICFGFLIFVMLAFAFLFDRLSLPLARIVLGFFDDRERNVLKIKQSFVRLLWSPFLALMDSKAKEMQALRLNLQDLQVYSSIAKITQNLAHDMRAPLGNFERLLLGDDKEPLEKHKAVLRESLNRLHGMIDSLRHPDGEFLIKRTVGQLDFSCGLESIEHRAKRKGIRLVFTGTALGEAYMDQAKFERMWINLLDNAIDAARSRVHLSVRREGSGLLLEVIDDGPGVSDQLMARLFERGATYGKAGGSGLGLAFVRQTVRGHGGDVVYRRENKLTTFEVRIPFAFIPPSERSAAPAAAKADGLPLLVSLCVKPEDLRTQVYQSLRAIGDERYQFSQAYSAQAHLLITNDDEALNVALENEQEFLHLDKALRSRQIVERLLIKLALRKSPA